MSRAIPNQSSTSANFHQTSKMTCLLLASLLMLFSHRSVVLAQQPMFIEELPVDPQGFTIPSNNTTFPQRTIDYQAVPSYQNNLNIERYLVYVEGNDPQLLEQVRFVEPDAYIRQFQGRSAIQVGVFNRLSNAQQLVRELQGYGIGGVRIVSFADGQIIETPTIANQGNVSRSRLRYYYVAIPASSQDLPSIEDQVRQRLDRRIGIAIRNAPRGPHLAVGPFLERQDAEQWNSYLRNMGFRNARVYYGR